MFFLIVEMETRQRTISWPMTNELYSIYVIRCLSPEMEPWSSELKNATSSGKAEFPRL